MRRREAHSTENKMIFNHYQGQQRLPHFLFFYSKPSTLFLWIYKSCKYPKKWRKSLNG